MEFGVRELVQFGTLLASLAGAFAVVKSQLSRVIQDIKYINTELHELNTRLDRAEADSAVVKHQNEVFGTILSPANLKDLNRSIAELQTEMRVVHNSFPSMAVDIVPYPVDWENIHRFNELSDVMKKACETVGVENLYWGYDLWKWDMPHWELR